MLLISSTEINSTLNLYAVKCSCRKMTLTVVCIILLLCKEVHSNPFDNGKPGTLHPPVVQTSYGPVRGLFLPQGMQAYLGIPYAKPPVKKLRWQPPMEPTTWGPDVYDAFQFSPGCPQKCFGNDLSILCPPTVSITWGYPKQCIVFSSELRNNFHKHL